MIESHMENDLNPHIIELDGSRLPGRGKAHPLEWTEGCTVRDLLDALGTECVEFRFSEQFLSQGAGLG